MKDHFYTHNARKDKIYIFRNEQFVNQLMYNTSTKQYGWFSLNHCGNNWGFFNYKSIREAIEDVMDAGCGHFVYQLDTLKELAEFIMEEEN